MVEVAVAVDLAVRVVFERHVDGLDEQSIEEELAVVRSYRHRGNRRAAAEIGRRVDVVVDDHRAHRAGGGGVGDEDAGVAGALVPHDQGDVAGQVVGDRLAGIRGRRHAVDDQLQIAGQAVAGAAVVGRVGDVGARDRARRVDGRELAEGIGPHEHLHAAGEAVRRGREVGVIGARRRALEVVLGIGLDLVATDAAVAVGVELEVAGGLVEAVVVGEVVHHVVAVEQVGDRRRQVAALARLHGRVVGEVEFQHGAAHVAVGTESARVVAVAVLLGVDVVAPGVGELAAGDAVGVVPGEGRRGGIGGIDDQGLAAGVLQIAERREGDHQVRVVAGPVVLVDHLAGDRVDADVPPVGRVDQVEVGLPGQAHAAVLERLVDQPDRDLAVGQRGVGEDGAQVGAAVGAQRGELGRGQAEVLGGGDDRRAVGQQRAADVGLGGQVADEAVVEVDDAAVAGDVDAEQAVVDLDAAEALLQDDMGDAVVPGEVAIADDDVPEVGFAEPELAALALEVGVGDVEGVAFVRAGEEGDRLAGGRRAGRRRRGRDQEEEDRRDEQDRRRRGEAVSVGSGHLNLLGDWLRSLVPAPAARKRGRDGAHDVYAGPGDGKQCSRGGYTFLPGSYHS